MNKGKPVRGWVGWLRGFAFSVASVAAIIAPCSPARGDEAAIPAARFLSALDLEGRTHRIGNGEGYRAVVLVFMTTECPISREYVPELNRLFNTVADPPVKFLGVIREPGLKRSAAVKFQKEFKIQFPLLFDASGELAAALEPTHVPEAFLLNSDAKVVYRGRIDDQYFDLGKKRATATTHELADAIEAVLNGKAVEVARTTPVGCPLETKRSASGPANVTYNRDIAPIFFANCAECHRPGEVAPFSLLTHEDAAKRAEFLSDVTRSRRMPPWKAEIGHGRFLGERYLTNAQIDLIESWAKAGAPEGDPEDRPPQPQFASGWRLGHPDLELKAPAPFTVPAGGEDIFQHFIIPLDLPENKTVVGFEFRPGNPSVVHHAILFLDTSGVGRRKDAETPEPGYTTFGSIGIPVAGIIGVWTPGMTPRFYPQGAGMPVRKGADLVLQLHMHPNGKEQTDQSSIALYFADKPVERTMARSPFVVGSLLIDITPGSRDHRVTSSVTLPADVTLISLLPHMHLVGKEMKLTATLPDGTVQPLIWIKDWNFYWQDNYVYREPVHLPRGTRLDVMSRYDNSAENPLNPSNPPKRVLFGNGSTDEMCFGIFQIIVDRPGEELLMHGALLQTLLKEWKDADLDPEAREKILDEAGKLFGAGRGTFDRLLGGRRVQRRSDQDGDQQGAQPKP
ncbi:MAG: redoxin domain-containing protein [Planctomycetia bacterium]|nr:redoxin domain-containing protein [Planctomycetia bacterium]